MIGCDGNIILCKKHEELEAKYEKSQKKISDLESENAALKGRVFDLENELKTYKQPLHA